MFYPAKNSLKPDLVEKAKKLIESNLKRGSLTVRSKRTGEEYIIVQQYAAWDGWFVYKGCDLIVGDTSFDHAVRVLLNETR